MSNLKINKYFICELTEHYLSQLGFYYVASKSNQKKIVDLFLSLPFFFFDVTVQDMFYKVIKNNNVKAHIDSKKSLQNLCYNIYKDFCIKLNCPYKNYEDFYDNIKFKLTSDTYYMKKTKQNHIHSFIFSILFVGLIFIYYYLSKRLYP